MRRSAISRSESLPSADQDARRSTLHHNRLSAWRNASLDQRAAGDAGPGSSCLENFGSDLCLRQPHQPCGYLYLTVNVIGETLRGIDRLFQGGTIKVRTPDGFLLGAGMDQV